MKKKILYIIEALVLLLVALACVYFFMISDVKGDKSIDFNIEVGNASSTVIANLKESELIRSEFFTKVVVKLNSDLVIKAGNYKLNQDMSVKDILEVFDKGNPSGEVIRLTFKEGKRVVDYLKIIADNTDLVYDDLVKEVNDKKFIKELIEEYWFLTDDILDDNIYYALEGYLFPSTYEFYKNSNIEDMIRVILNHTKNVLESLEGLDKSEFSVHEVFTLASMIESEAKTLEDRKGVSGVFINRLNSGWTLGSDVTTYYAVGKDFVDGLTMYDLNSCDNFYNTRCSSLGGLPIGPVGNPGKDSIDAAINPSVSSYMYFVADCKGKTYFNVNESGHVQIINKLRSEGNWCEK